MAAPVSRTTWRTVGASAAGSAHLHNGTPCQDAFAVGTTASGHLVVAVADGAGSASRSEEGAQAAVGAAVAFLSAAEVDAPLEEMVADAVRAARCAVHAAAGDADASELATTLTVIVAADAGIACAQVGDGAAVIRRDGALVLVDPVERGEYLNETCFLTSSGWREELRVASIESAGVDAIAVMTDGLQLLALDLVSQVPHPGFFVPLFDWAERGGEAEELGAFLASERVCSRTDDDKTLVLATSPPTALR